MSKDPNQREPINTPSGSAGVTRDEPADREADTVAPFNASIIKAMQLQTEQLLLLRENLNRLDNREHERRLQLHEEVLASGLRDEAITSACRAVMLGALPSVSVFLIVAWLRSAFVNAIGALIFFGIPFCLVLAAVGIGCGLFAQMSFKNTPFPVVHVAVAMAVLFDLTLVGWAFFLPRWL